RAEGRTGHRREGGLPGPLRVYQSRLRIVSPVDATVSVPALVRRGRGARACGPGLGEAGQAVGLSHASGRCTADRLAARSALTGRRQGRPGVKGFIHRLLRDEGGATAVEYGLICGLIGMVVLAALGAFS